MQLSEDERIAKESFLLLIKESTQNDCDTEFLNTDLPVWYDDEKYKRGQKFYIDNRVGILNATVCGAIISLSDNKALKVLSSTGKSSTKETAGPRYISTIQHFLKWYENVLIDSNSESRKSLDKVRKLHVINSKKAKENGLGAIKQFELVLVAFGFYAFIIFRSQFFGIRDDNQTDQEGFIHFWAVVSRMVGVHDKYNICLLPFDSLEILSHMIRRYILVPLVQEQKPLFKKMVTAFIDGFGPYISNPIDYETQIFLTQMICGVPGYQYGCDLNKEIFSRSDILTKTDINDCNKILKDCLKDDEYFEITYDIPVVIDMKNDQKQLEYINYEDNWRNVLNDKKFYEMNSKGQRIVRIRHYFNKFYEYSVFRYLLEWWASWEISNVKKLKL